MLIARNFIGFHQERYSLGEVALAGLAVWSGWWAWLSVFGLLACSFGGNSLFVVWSRTRAKFFKKVGRVVSDVDAHVRRSNPLFLGAKVLLIRLR